MHISQIFKFKRVLNELIDFVLNIISHPNSHIGSKNLLEHQDYQSQNF